MALLPGEDPPTPSVLNIEGKPPLVIRLVQSLWALELEAARVVTSCETFTVDARTDIHLRAGGAILQTASERLRLQGRAVEVEATRGAVRVRANDDVQLLGEQVLLNCERPPTVPAWSLAAAPAPGPLPRAAVSGDEELARAMTETGGDADAPR